MRGRTGAHISRALAEPTKHHTAHAHFLLVDREPPALEKPDSLGILRETRFRRVKRIVHRGKNLRPDGQQRAAMPVNLIGPQNHGIASPVRMLSMTTPNIAGLPIEQCCPCPRA
jgi:hypothetical protein